MERRVDYSTHERIMEDFREVFKEYFMRYILLLIFLTGMLLFTNMYAGRVAAKSAEDNHAEAQMEDSLRASIREKVIEELYGNREQYAKDHTGSRADYVDKAATAKSTDGSLVIDEKRMNQVYESKLKEYDARVDNSVVDAMVEERLAALTKSQQQSVSAKSDVSPANLLEMVGLLVFAGYFGWECYTRYMALREMEKMEYSVMDAELVYVKLWYPRRIYYRLTFRCENGEEVKHMAIPGRYQKRVKNGKHLAILLDSNKRGVMGKRISVASI